MKIFLVTKNQGKLMAADSVFSKYNITLSLVDKDYPEIQADTSMEIAKFTALEVAKTLNAPAIREDHSLYIKSLNFPGPYTNYYEKKVSATMLLDWLKNYDDRSGYFEVATVYAEPNGFVKEFIFQVPIIIAKKERGELQKGWAKLFILEGDNRTFAEYSESERVSVWNKNYQAIAEFLIAKKV